MFDRCLNCVNPERHIGCHDNCYSYKKDKDKLAMIRAEKDKQVLLNTRSKIIRHSV